MLYRIVTTEKCTTGESFVSLSYLYRLGRTTIGCIVHQVCEVIASALQNNYLQVNVQYSLFS